MKNKYKLIFSNDDIGCAGANYIRYFKETVNYLERKGIKATFFWVPKADGKPGYDNREWMKAIEWAVGLGHDIQWHGYGHHCLEFGLPQDGLRRENKGAFEEYERNKAHWDNEHGIPRIRAKMAEAYEIFKRAFGRPPVIFRSPCIGVSDAMYAGLHELGVRFSSSRVINPKSWVYSAFYDKNDRVWETEFPPYPYQIGQVVEIPLMSDCCHWGIPDEKYHDLLDLVKSDYANLIRESKGLGVLLSHYHSMHKNWGNCLKFYDELLDYLASKHSVEFVTFAEVCKQMTSK